MSQIAVVGAGWAGVAAALTLARAGLNVTVFEAGKIAGGRARQVEHDGRCFDNGQHLLLGAYERSISLIRSLHSSIDQVVLRQPLSLSSAPCSLPSLSMRAPRIKAPLHLLAAMISARGLSLREKVVSAAWAATQMSRKPIVDTATVSELLSDQPEAARELLWEPLCVAALNTPPERAVMGRLARDRE